MKRYKVIRDNVGFQRRMWREGTIVDLEDHETPPHHFVLLENVQPVNIPVHDPMAAPLVEHKSYSVATASANKIPKTGMAAGLDSVVDATVKRGARKSSTKGSGK